MPKKDEAEVDVTRISSFRNVKSLIIIIIIIVHEQLSFRDRSHALKKQGSIPCSTMTREPERGAAMETANVYLTIGNKDVLTKAPSDRLIHTF